MLMSFCYVYRRTRRSRRTSRLVRSSPTSMTRRSPLPLPPETRGAPSSRHTLRKKMRSGGASPVRGSMVRRCVRGVTYEQRLMRVFIPFLTAVVIANVEQPHLCCLPSSQSHADSQAQLTCFISQDDRSDTGRCLDPLPLLSALPNPEAPPSVRECVCVWLCARVCMRAPREGGKFGQIASRDACG